MRSFLSGRVVLRGGGLIAFAALALPGLCGLRGYVRTGVATLDVNAEISPAAAGALEAKMRALSESTPGKSTVFKPIVVTELEANSYLKYHGQEFLPPGVDDPEIHITPGGVSGAADVDFNKLNQTAQRDDWGAKLLSAVFRGRQRVSATGKLETGDGQGKVTIQNVVVGTMALPDPLVNFLLENYVQKWYKIDASKPFVLPDHVTHIALGPGSATFYRSPKKTVKVLSDESADTARGRLR